LRADMPWAGYERPIAPRLTELEKRSVSYTRAYAISSYTSMSLGGLLGGKLPSEMKRSGYFFGKYPADNLMFPELLQAKGVRTIGAQAHGYFKEAGFDQGFDVWELVPDLKFDNKILRRLFVMGIVLAVAVYMAYLLSMGVFIEPAGERNGASLVG
jgi:arylsulfatase A-like enzyme